MTTQEAATALGIDSGSRIGDLGQASAVLKFFGVEPTIGQGVAALLPEHGEAKP